MEASLLDLSDLTVAVCEERERRPRLLPADVSVKALTGTADEVAEWVDSLLRGPFIPTPEETIAVSKAGHGIRPVAVWDLQSRVTYRALANNLGGSLPALSPSRTRWREFQREPLNHPGAYVVATDIASCYQYIDHVLLSEELLVQNCDFPTVNAITNLLAETSGKSYSLPQQSWPSDLLADALLGKLQRVLVRRGLQVCRYSDDFRFTCRSWSEAIRAIEVFSEVTRQLGLTMNDLKTITWKRKTYETHLDKADALREEIADEAKLDLTRFETDWYDDSLIKTAPDPSDVDYLAAKRILERWSKVAARSAVRDSRKAEHRALTELLSFALSTLAADASTDPTVIDHLLKVLRYGRTKTPAVANYIVGRDEPDLVVKGFDKLLRSKAYLNGWQTWWLQESISKVAGFTNGKGAPARLKWISDALISSEHAPTLRAYSALALARHKAIGYDRVLSLYDRSSAAVRPVLVAAIATLQPPKSVEQSVTKDSRLHKIVFDWALQDA